MFYSFSFTITGSYYSRSFQRDILLQRNHYVLRQTLSTVNHGYDSKLDISGNEDQYGENECTVAMKLLSISPKMKKDFVNEENRYPPKLLVML